MRPKRARGEMGGKLCIAAHACIWLLIGEVRAHTQKKGGRGSRWMDVCGKCVGAIRS